MALNRVLLLALLCSAAFSQNLTFGGTPAVTNTSSSDACASLHIIVVRASLEPPSQGVIGTLATLITAANPGSTVEWIAYPATLSNYAQSSYAGVEATTQRLMNYTDACAGSQVVLLGYSQGAHVIGDVMCGGGEAAGLGPYSPPLAQNYSASVIAMIQMGDPRFVVNKTFDVGTAMQDGIFPRPANISCDGYASIIQSYCDANDPYCASGNNLTVHLIYDELYNQAAFNFVQAKVKSPSTSSTSSSGTVALATATAKSIGAVLTAKESLTGMTSMVVFAMVVGFFVLGL